MEYRITIDNIGGGNEKLIDLLGNAIEKQASKEINWKESLSVRFSGDVIMEIRPDKSIPLCPTCNKEFNKNEIKDEFYCSECGQKIVSNIADDIIDKPPKCDKDETVDDFIYRLVNITRDSLKELSDPNYDRNIDFIRKVKIAEEYINNIINNLSSTPEDVIYMLYGNEYENLEEIIEEKIAEPKEILNELIINSTDYQKMALILYDSEYCRYKLFRNVLMKYSDFLVYHNPELARYM